LSVEENDKWVSSQKVYFNSECDTIIRMSFLVL